LDRLDIRILKLLLAGNGIPPGVPAVRKSFRSMARNLRVDQGTVRSRMKKLQQAGTLKGWYLGLSPALTGESVANVWLDLEPGTDKRRVIDELLAVPGVERVCGYLGRKISLALLYRKQRDLDVALRRIAKSSGSGGLHHAPGGPQARSPEISESDAAIIVSLLEDPWKPYAAVAKQLGFSAKTVKRRATRLFESGAIYVVPDLDLKTLQGIIPAELVISFGSDSPRADALGALASRLREEIVFSQASGSRAYFALAVPNVSMVEAIGEYARRQEGVVAAETQVLQEVDLSPSHYKSTRLAVGLDADGMPTLERVAFRR
jgi:DNA-binding Lrp family transcriptional regulator